MRSLAALFGSSPFDPLQAHMLKAVACSEQIPALIDALIEGRGEEVIAIQKRISALESEADAIKNDLRGHLPRRLFLPVDRRDLLELLDMQDTIADSAEDIGDLLVVRTWVVPTAMHQPLRDFAKTVTDAALGAGKVMARLDELASAAFAGPEVATISALIAEVLRIEEEADDLEVALQRIVFEEEEAIGTLGVVMWLRLLEVMGDVADYSKKACNRLRLLIAS